jgi:hypothetical protein
MSNIVLRPGQVARICRVCPRTVHRWIDSGILMGRRLPDSEHRRVYVGDLRAFMKAHGMPMEWLDGPGEPEEVVRTAWGTVELAAPQGG